MLQKTLIILSAVCGSYAFQAIPTHALDIGEYRALPLDQRPYLECVPYARHLSGIEIYGDAHTWWEQAQARYATGHRPKVGAVMSLPPFSNMRLGHVASVSRILDSRTILLKHANWSEINGRRGHIEDNVRAVDVSAHNDWSLVRVWYEPIGALGNTQWPVNGFIYNEKTKAQKRNRDGNSLTQTTLAQSSSGRINLSHTQSSRESALSTNRMRSTSSNDNQRQSTMPSTSRDPIGDLIRRGQM